jgi:hypothetical protein
VRDVRRFSIVRALARDSRAVLRMWRYFCPGGTEVAKDYRILYLEFGISVIGFASDQHYFNLAQDNHPTATFKICEIVIVVVKYFRSYIG